MNVSGVWKESYIKTINITISTNTTDFDAFTGFSSPTDPAFFIVTINSGIIVSSSLSSTPAFTIDSSFPVGSRFKIINNGQIIGKGGDGGDGGEGGLCGSDNDGIDGIVGGDAIDINEDTIIDNTGGDIFSGGGGGGGGAGGLNISIGPGGGGGGGGAGNETSSGGLGIAPCACTGGGPDSDGVDGIDGTTTGGGGGAGGVCNIGGGDINGGNGGNGGEYGLSGDNGTTSDASVSGGPGNGAAPGKAIELNGSSVTWLGGNNPTQVKGAVS